MINFITRKKGAGQFNVEVMIDHSPAGQFDTTDAMLIDDIDEWLNGEDDFWYGESRAELEFHIKKLAGVVSTDIAGVDFSEDIDKLFNL